MTTITREQLDEKYARGIKRYEEGAPLAELLPYFEELRKIAPGDVRLSISLGWLHMLLGHQQEAFAFNREARNLPQGRFNLALACLTFGEKGFRQHFEAAMNMGHEAIHDAIDNLEDAIQRKGGSYPAAEKMLRYIHEAHSH